MKKRILLLALLFVNFLMAQVGINTVPHVSAELDVTSTSKGLLIPRLNTAAINTLTATASEGLIVFNTTTKQFLGFNGTTWQLLGAVQTATFAGWEVNGLSAYGSASFSATTISSLITSAILTRGTGLGTVPTAAGNAWGGTGFDQVDLAAAVTNNDFFSVTLVLPSTNVFSFTKIPALNFRRPGSGPQSVQWQYSVGGGAYTNLGSATGPMTDTGVTGNIVPETTLSSISALQNLTNTTVVFRLVGYGPTATGGAGYINNGNISNDLEIIGTYY